MEQEFADVASGPGSSSGVFAVNTAWLSITAIAHNLIRAAGALASLAFVKVRRGGLTNAKLLAQKTDRERPPGIGRWIEDEDE